MRTHSLRKFVIARERKKRLNGGEKGPGRERERERERDRTDGRRNNCALKSAAVTVGNIRSRRSVADGSAVAAAAAYIQSAHTRIKERTGHHRRARAADRKTRLSDCLPQSYNPTWMMTEIMNDDDNNTDCLSVCLCCLCRCGVASVLQNFAGRCVAAE